MTTSAPDRLSAHYHHDDAPRRADFDRALGRYLRGHHDPWDVTPLLEALERLGRDVDDITLTLEREAGGALTATLRCALEPTEAAAARPATGTA
ncbi:hypothetical protein [Kitasatospora sp. KL5]|uniref:hypothetical protein n=1 Tax=Kitasatospora sp. KL5 TaxID=3425125 RepID=UPI003D6ED275